MKSQVQEFFKALRESKKQSREGADQEEEDLDAVEGPENMPKKESCFKSLRNFYNEKTDSLCAFCGNTCNSGCSWSEAFVPVEGWTAKENKNGYFVFACPEFRSDAWMHEDPQALDTEGCIALMEAFVGTMRQDYIEDKRQRKPIESFVHNPRFRDLFWFCDPDELIENFRKGIT